MGHLSFQTVLLLPRLRRHGCGGEPGLRTGPVSPRRSALYTAAVFIGAASGLLVNFLLNYAFNFHYRGRGMLLGQFRTFFVVAAIGTVLTAVLARLLLFLLHLCGITSLTLLDHAFSAELMAHMLSVGLVIIYSFLGHKYLSFNMGIRAQLQRLFKNRRDHA